MQLETFIFTKDRACQLRLLLESIDRNATNVFHHNILWKASSDEFRRGYELVMKEYPQANWIEECLPIKDEFLKVIGLAGERGGTLTIFTDDCIFYRKEMIEPAVVKAALDTSLTVSFRYGFNTVIQNYLTGERQPPLRNYELKNGLVEWDYRSYHYTNNNGYPFGEDGHVFLTSDLVKWVEITNMKTMRDLEGGMSLPKNRDFQNRTKISCYPHSLVINNPANSVQSDPTPSGTRHPLDLSATNAQFLGGKVIDLDAIDFSDVCSCHYEFRLTFRERNGFGQ